MATTQPTVRAGTAQITSPAIDVQELNKVYPGRIQALTDLSFQVASGSVFGLLGPNGAGKSTAVKILTTLTTPDSGRALVCGIDVVRRPFNVRDIIGYVAQMSGVDPDASGRENLMLQGQLYGMPGSKLKRRVAELLDSFSLTEAAERLVKTYSGGMKRKLDVAMGIVHRPRVLFLDEPTTGLDPEARAEMWQEIEHLTHEGMTILLTTHYLDEADHLAQRVAIVDRGKVVVEGTPDQLKQELQGDTIQIELEHESHHDLREILTLRSEVREVAIDGRMVRARVENGATALPVIMSTLEASGIAISSVTVARPSLDDVYFRYSGKTFARAHEEGSR